MATHYFIRNGDFSDTLKIAEMLLQDTHDLIHKAAGWMLREVGKRDDDTAAAEEAFLEKHYNVMLRTLEKEAAEVLAGRANTVSARHYLMVEVDRLTGQVVDAWKKFGVEVCDP